MEYEKRRAKLASKLLKEEIDSILITSLPNLKYFFNYGGASFERFCAGLISVKERSTAIVLPKLDEGKAASTSVDGVFTWTDSEGYELALEEALKSIGGKSKVFGCEDWITLYQMEEVRQVRAKAKFQSISQEISGLRLTKSEEEVNALKNSAAKLAKGYETIPRIFKVGMSETEAAFEIRRTLAKCGVTEVDFCGVQSGPNSAIPHSLTSARKFSAGDMIVVDITSADESGYFADFTRTFCVGKSTEEQRKVYEAVKEAQSIGVKASRPGVPAKSIDKEVRTAIQSAGYGEFFIHRTGHGLGLEVHEAPWINDSNSMKLKPGMIFTVEPGVYLPSKFGVRIEDNVVVTESGCENLTRLTHELVEV